MAVCCSAMARVVEGRCAEAEGKDAGSGLMAVGDIENVVVAEPDHYFVFGPDSIRSQLGGDSLSTVVAPEGKAFALLPTTSAKPSGAEKSLLVSAQEQAFDWSSSGIVPAEEQLGIVPAEEQLRICSKMRHLFGMMHGRNYSGVFYSLAESHNLPCRIVAASYKSTANILILCNGRGLLTDR